MSRTDKKDAAVRFDPDNYVKIEYDPEVPDVDVTIIKNGEIIIPSGSYVTIEQLNAILANYVNNSELETTLADYVENSDLTATLADYVENSDLTATLADYVENSDLTATLADYVENSDLTATLADYVENSDLTATLADYVENSDLTATLADYVENSDLTTILLDYVTTNVFSNYKLKYIDVTISGTKTIPSVGYLKVADAPAEIGLKKKIAGLFISYFSSINGSIVPTLGSSNSLYFYGTNGNSITDAKIGVLYYE